MDARISWLCVAGACTCWVGVVLLVMLQLASGYSFAFLGIWTPPNTDVFRRLVGAAVVLALVSSTVLGALPAWRWYGAVRPAGAIPAALAALALAVLAFSALADAFA